MNEKKLILLPQIWSAGVILTASVVVDRVYDSTWLVGVALGVGFALLNYLLLAARVRQLVSELPRPSSSRRALLGLFIKMALLLLTLFALKRFENLLFFPFLLGFTAHMFMGILPALFLSTRGKRT